MAQKAGSDAGATRNTTGNLLAENPSMTGFENPGKALYTTTRELVENSLDAIDMIDAPTPYIKISIQEFEEGNTLQSKKTGKGRTLQKQEIGKGDSSERKKYFRISCQDNGIGVAFKDIPELFARSGCTTKSIHKQSRGRLGFGLKNALIYSHRSTFEPMKVESSTRDEQEKSVYELRVNLKPNGSVIVSQKRVPKDEQHGTTVELAMEGNWYAHQKKILSYLEQTALVTPYVRIEFLCIPLDGSPVEKTYPQRENQRLPVPRVGKFDPSSAATNLAVLLSRSSATTILDFLEGSFANVDSATALEFIATLGPSFTQETSIHTLTTEQTKKLKSGFEDYDFGEPDTSCLVPLGECLIKGIQYYLGDEILIAYAEKRSLGYDGYPYVLEAAITVGGKADTSVIEGVNLFRFANYAPLLYEQGSDIIMKEVKKLKWDEYNIVLSEKVCIFVSFISTTVPFAGPAKEVIKGTSLISKEISAILQDCCKQMQQLLLHRVQKRNKQEILKYIPKAAEYFLKLIEGCTNMKDSNETYNDEYKQVHFGSNEKRLKTLSDLESHLRQHVDRKYP